MVFRHFNFGLYNFGLHCSFVSDVNCERTAVVTYAISELLRSFLYYLLASHVAYHPATNVHALCSPRHRPDPNPMNDTGIERTNERTALQRKSDYWDGEGTSRGNAALVHITEHMH